MGELNYKKIMGFILVIGVIIGVLYTNLFAKEYILESGILGDSYLQTFLSREIIISEYILQVLWTRIKPILIIVFLSYTRFSKIGIMCILLWWGTMLGVYFSMGLMLMGVKGIIFNIISFLPHFILYMPAYYILCLYGYGSPKTSWNFSKSILIIVCILSGIVLECNINPLLVKWFIKIM